VDELELAERVAAGAEFMDAIDSVVTAESERWFWVVNPDRLDMSTSTGGHRRECGCIFGQHSPSGFYNNEDYGISWWDSADLGFDAKSHGDLSRLAEYKALTALWREAIIDRRAAWFDAHPEYVIA
jgi:hypothetical protein